MKMFFTIVSFSLFAFASLHAQDDVTVGTYTSDVSGIVYKTNVTGDGSEDAAEQSMFFSGNQCFLGVAQNGNNLSLKSLVYDFTTPTTENFNTLWVNFSESQSYSTLDDVQQSGTQHFVGYNNSLKVGQIGSKFIGIRGYNSESVHIKTLTLVWTGYDGEDKTDTITYGSFSFGPSGTVGIDNIGVDSTTADAEWFTLTGARVANPQPGSVYILRQGDKATKVIR